MKHSVFISYAGKDKDTAEKICSELERNNIKCWIAPRDITPGMDYSDWIPKAVKASKVLIVVYSKNSNESDFVKRELSIAATNKVVIISFKIEDVPPSDSMEFFLAVPQWLNASQPPLSQHLPKLLQAVNMHLEASVSADPHYHEPEVICAPPDADYSGVFPASILHEGKKRLPGEVIAVELLQRPIRIFYNKETDRFTVRIDRRGVEKALITTSAKAAICREFVEAKRDMLTELDNEVHQFLLGNTEKTEFTIDLPELGIPLRWASGGVFSVINRWVNNRREQWSPFFFRDINPWGWNIALGSSERQFNKDGCCIRPIEDELNHPSEFIYREFLEETLILDRAPRAETQLRFKRFYFDESRAISQQRNVGRFVAEHVQMREEEEDLLIDMSEHTGGGFGNDITRLLDVFDTRIDLDVRDRDGNHHLTSNVLITFNLLELGIEIIKVLKYNIEEENYMLDGEILYRKNGAAELVRMPSALISHEALKRSFSKGNYNPRYTSEIQPSVVGQDIRNDEIKVFEWNIDQRFKRMTSSSSHISDLEKKRYREAYETFPDVFKDKSFLTGKVPNCFTPASAKALSLYFSRLEDR